MLSNNRARLTLHELDHGSNENKTCATCCTCLFRQEEAGGGEAAAGENLDHNRRLELCLESHK